MSVMALTFEDNGMSFIQPIQSIKEPVEAICNLISNTNLNLTPSGLA
jgi:hypothetical protein